MDGGCTTPVPCLISPLSVKCAVSWTFCLQALNIKAVCTTSTQTELELLLSPACQSHDGNVCIGSEPTMMVAQGPDVGLIVGIVVVILVIVAVVGKCSL